MSDADAQAMEILVRYQEAYIKQLEEEISILREYGNHDCTDMADEELKRRYEAGTLNPS